MSCNSCSNITLPQGATGAQGASGTNGTDGTVVLMGQMVYSEGYLFGI
jgi:hypothetical protein